MDENQILTLLTRISSKLDKGETYIKKNEWDAVGKLFTEINTLQEKIKKNEPPVETLLSNNPSFKKKYEPLKKNLLDKANKVISTIEKWKLEHTEKITASKNVLDNISKYYKPGNTSYYIDTKE
jgi:regulator of replication initiation timing